MMHDLKLGVCRCKVIRERSSAVFAAIIDYDEDVIRASGFQVANRSRSDTWKIRSLIMRWHEHR
jgi:hypothetical protein